MAEFDYRTPIDSFVGQVFTTKDLYRKFGEIIAASYGTIPIIFRAEDYWHMAVQKNWIAETDIPGDWTVLPCPSKIKEHRKRGEFKVLDVALALHEYRQGIAYGSWNTRKGLMTDGEARDGIDFLKYRLRTWYSTDSPFDLAIKTLLQAAIDEYKPKAEIEDDEA